MHAALVEQAQRGDRGAFEVLAAEAIDRLYSAAVIVIHDSALAEDAVQVTLIRAWRGLPRLREPARFEAWLNRILVRACMDTAKAARPRDVSPIPSAWPDDGPGFEGALTRRDEVGRCLARLTPAERAVLVLRFFLELSVPEIAAALGVPLGTAKSRLHHALAAMRAAIDADGRVAVQGGVA